MVKNLDINTLLIIFIDIVGLGFINPFMSNGLFCPISLDQSISSGSVCGLSFYYCYVV